MSQRIKTLQRSFSHGEISPELAGRVDLASYQTGLAKCLNFNVLPLGPLQNRAGYEYVNETKDSTKQSRVIDFAYSTEQTYALELGDGYIRIHSQSETVLEAAQAVSGITQANPAVVYVPAHGYSTSDWVYVGDATGMTQINGEFYLITVVDGDHFSLSRLDGSSVDSSAFGAYTGSGQCARPLEVTGTVPYVEADLFDLHYTQTADVLTICHPTYAPREVNRVSATSWTIGLVSFAPTISAPGAPTVSYSGTGGTPVAIYYATTALASGTLEESSLSPSGTANGDLTIAGNEMTVTTAAVAGAVRYNVYKLLNGIWGYIGQTDGSPFVDNYITPDVSTTPPIIETPFAASGDYPGAVGWYGGRRWFGGTNNTPQGIWATRSGTESSMAYSIPTRDDDRIALTILSGKVDLVRHLVALYDLLALTSGGEWRLAADNSDVLTPDSVDPKPQANEGSSNVMPVVVGSEVVYVDSSGARVMSMAYHWNAGLSGAYTPENLSIMATHLFDNYTIAQLAYVHRPYKMVFGVRSDGALLGLTYLPEQEVIAWHQHTTNGTFESVTSVQEGAEWPLYAVVKRTINVRDVRYIDRQRSRIFATQSEAFFVCCGATYAGGPVTTISNLWFLEGCAVSCLANGAVVSGLVVTNGTITLPDEAAQEVSNTVHIGLGYNSDLQTLPLTIESAQAAGLGNVSTVNAVQFKVMDSSTIFAGPTFDSLREYKQRSNEPYGSPPALKTGSLKPLAIDPDWAVNGAVCVRNSDPVPLTITAMVLEVALGG